ALPDADFGRQMKYTIDILQCPTNRTSVTHVRLDALCIGRQRDCLAAMDLLDKRIENTDLVSPLQQRVAEKATDEACPAGHQITSHQQCPLIQKGGAFQSASAKQQHRLEILVPAANRRFPGEKPVSTGSWIGTIGQHLRQMDRVACE